VLAATVDVRVQDEQGTAMPAQMVPPGSLGEDVQRTAFERTGESGSATFVKLKPGTYELGGDAGARVRRARDEPPSTHRRW
jgi:hypothetical protein